ncbi:MAG: GtrA family protein [Flavobacteriales bacterium]|jgi:putative flippase GtrA|nr:GtrA family protein [Flavobacteriales bacterium]
MFSDLAKSFLKNTTLNLTASQVNLLLSVAENKYLAYILIGAFAASLDVVLFIFLHESVNLQSLICHSISVPISALFSFSVNAYLNFKKTDVLLSRFFSFSVVISIGYVLGFLIIFVIDSVLQFGGTVGKLISLPFVATLQFYLNSKTTFKD